MNNRTEILVIGRNPQFMQNVLRLLNSRPQWAVVGALTDEEAIEQFHHHDFDLAIIGGGVEQESEKKLRKVFLHQNPRVIIFRHYDGGGLLLLNEIDRMLQSRTGVQITDDPFRQP